jgi:raffinose/stachyose/melibiose transport system permease protein
MTSRSERYVTHAVLILFSLGVIVPLLIILGAALHEPGELTTGFGFPSSLNFDTFRDAWVTGHFSAYMRSSVIVTASVVLISSVLSTLAGYALGTMRFRGAETLSYVFLLGLMVPFEAMIIPLYYDMRQLGLTESYWSLILPQSALSLSFGTFWMRAFFRSVPRQLIEAARVDNASSWTVLWRILVPIGWPAISTMVVLLFMFSWNEFLLALVLVDASDAHRTAPLGLANFQSRFGTDVAGVSAASLLVALPVFVVYLFLHRRFIRGMLGGAIKG